ncbi:DCC1-like thiol-disulfide oxidoreductase family protein [Leptothoe sp. PORK10 BA2]|uniref:DCC1-like thiol-disulfide oxidoreductase family protein n=1 Tax=Leptothoe sp. PORK10 BA2 TaxID=3110254 RepID=UPI002B214916|nr:DCC1-like thiol-disulfide oxidoreductase family protein [Leptothoe sp. PORK10 BA2]MEA5462319.1 DCC1-like thiol-disulfide oxidoreductase family protein [Leptothoe sp. PORK10 BA2]
MAIPIPRLGFLEKRYGLDLRSLALLRMGLALVILADLFTRMGDLIPHYTDVGVLPRQAAAELLPDGYWSLHLISGHPWVQAGLFAIAIAIALALLVGYKTRLATIASWAMLVSLHNRNPVLIFAADDVLRAVMFWAMFLPLGAQYSIDSALNSARLPKRFFGVATIALMVQQCYIYMFSAFFKTTSSTWWPEGSAVYYSLSFDQYVTPLGAWLLNLGALLPIFTLFTLVLEWVGPLFLFVPIRTDLFRNLAIVTFILLHLGFGLTLNLGIFPVLSVVTWLAFIPTSTWEGWTKRFYGREQDGLVIYYDADCGFCKKVVHLIRTLVLLPATPLRTTQSDPDIYAAMERYNSWVVVDWQGQQHYKFEAIAYVCSVSPGFRIFEPLLRWSPLMAAGNRVYEAIANNRRRAGLFTRPFKFKSFSVGPSWLNNGLAAILLLLISLWNLRSITHHHAFVDSPNPAIQTLRRITHSRTANRLQLPMQAARLDQSWSIFSPGPPRDDGWHGVTGTLTDGSPINLLQPDRPIATDKPTLAQRQAIYKNLQWRTYFINLNRSGGEKLYPHYGDYVCRRWNQRHTDGQRLNSISVSFTQEPTVPPGEQQTTTVTQPWSQSCPQ